MTRLPHPVPFGGCELFGLAELLRMLALAGRSGTLVLDGGAEPALLRLAGGRVLAGEVLARGSAVERGAPAALAAPAIRRAAALHAVACALAWPAGIAELVPGSDALTGPGFELDALLLEAGLMLDAQHADEEVPPAGRVPLPWPGRRSEPGAAVAAGRAHIRWLGRRAGR